MRLVARLRRVLIGGLFLIGMALSGCGGGSGGGGGSNDPTMRFYNASSDSISLNFLLDDDVVGQQLAYGQSTANFADQDADTRDLRLQENGTSIDIWSEVITLQKDRHYLVTALGLENFGSENLKRLRFVVNEINRTPPNGTRARLVIIHCYNRATGFETPSLDFQTPGDNPQFRAADIGYGASKILEVDAGNQTYEVRRGGTENVLFSKNVTLGGGKIYAVYLLGVEGETGSAEPKIEFVEIQPD